MHEDWVKVAGDHLRAAELLLNEGLYHLVSFHAQRAAAQALEATLDKNGVPAPHHGKLLELLGACEACDPEAASLRASCALLDLMTQSAATVSSDPGMAMTGMLPWGPPSYDQAEATLDAARKVVQTLGRITSRFALAAVA
jgi:HEPN domain-containing protein